MITWHPIDLYNKKRSRRLGESNAVERDEILTDFMVMWRTLFCEQIPSIENLEWNLVICGMVIDNGTFGLVATKEVERSLSQVSCLVCFANLRDELQSQFASSADYLAACHECEQRYVKMLTEAWTAVRVEHCICDLLGSMQFQFRVETSPENDEQPFLETVLN
ncbi:hypothetical protein [Thalassoroseus pseudoceratinae]|uniref:hypothetical protein n=1 Tax=Thalassoroseus pseudoceratinae TaxID=2713176 RepID=UPI001422A611|nr:hypothetical protein [Thalassoroseus pseudoceratinae]